MTGPEHYRAAEHMIEEAQDPAEPGDRAFLIAEAQVHATLALAAAFADGPAIMRTEDRDEWDGVFR